MQCETSSPSASDFAWIDSFAEVSLCHFSVSFSLAPQAPEDLLIGKIEPDVSWREISLCNLALEKIKFRIREFVEPTVIQKNEKVVQKGKAFWRESGVGYTSASSEI